MYAIFETGGKQYRAAPGDQLQVERVDVGTGETIVFTKVLLVNRDGQVSVGSPTVAEASIEADVVDHIRGPKQVVFKMKRRKGYQRKQGHRQELSVVRIKEIKA